MRLLHAKSLQFEQFMGVVVPKYAILSHRWLDTNQEVTFQDMCSGSYASATLKKGLNKIKRCAEQAMRDKLDYLWIDTCCIDKTSSAELSEAINSMYRWYRDAEVCYALLGDVSARDPPDPDFPTVSTFRASNWFTRGWTLQELIAPLNIIFYSKEWQQIGTKEDLIRYLGTITGISEMVLEGADPNTCSVAQRMSWAAKRVTTRVEDVAYCLLGIFDVNMPLLYGEGARAFVRLQEEIIKISDDQSIFAWEADESDYLPYVGLLASSPSYFAACGNIRSHGLWSENEPCSMTSKGLRTTLRLSPNTAEKGTFYARLECTYGPLNLKPIISLQLVSVFDYGNQYVRVQPYAVQNDRRIFAGSSVYRSVYVRQDIAQLFTPSRLMINESLSPIMNYFWIKSTPDFEVHDPVLEECWNSRARLFTTLGEETGRFLVTHLAGNYGSTTISLFFGSFAGSPFCWLADRNVASQHAVSVNRSSFGTKTQCVLRTDLRKSTIFATAITNTTTISDRQVFIITLFIKTVQ